MKLPPIRTAAPIQSISAPVDASVGIPGRVVELLHEGQSGTKSDSALAVSSAKRVTHQPDVLLVQNYFSGRVTYLNVKQGYFNAELEKQGRRKGQKYEATFALDEIPKIERELVEADAKFDWVIGRRISTSGREETVAVITFERLPKVTAALLRKHKSKTAEYAAPLATSAMVKE